MKVPINDKAGVLEELRMSLHICEVVVNHSAQTGEPSDMRTAGTARRDRLREAIRFIEEHSFEKLAEEKLS